MLKLRDVKVGYKNNVLINKVNLEITSGRLYIITGENGTGKTTLLKLLAGCISVINGEVIKDNVDIGYLPYNPQYPLFMNSYKYLSMFGKTYNKDYKELAIKYDLSNVLIHKLSKGNLIKLGLIQMLLCDFDIYLFDEINDGLDLDSKKILKQDIKMLLEKDKTIVISTHAPQIYKELNPIKLNIKDGKLYAKNK
jgi:ABC-type multidrug transport system ATPase subunit